MTTILADSFTASLAKLSNDEQKQAKLTAFDLQTNPDLPGLQLHRIDKSKDQNFWSVRVSGDLRIIIHKTGSSILLAHIGHHDDAYKWAERRRIETHPSTGALQIVEVRELVEERPTVLAVVEAAQDTPKLFASLSKDELLSVGVPTDWVDDVLAATDDSFFELVGHLPAEANDALMDYAQRGVLAASHTAQEQADPLQHPDTQRRFRVMDGIEEMRAALDAPFDKWTVFLHPSQRETVERVYGGPARVVGSAGTGKTVVALHRVGRILKQQPDARILLTTFSNPLSKALAHKLRLMVGDNTVLFDRVRVGSFLQIAKELFTLAHGRPPAMAQAQLIRNQLQKAAEDQDVTEVSSQFLLSEWENVIDAWQITSLATYADVPRIGRKSRLGPRQRERLWGVFDAVQAHLKSRQLFTEAGLFATVTDAYRTAEDKPFTHIVVDEAQDLGVSELRFLSAVSPGQSDAMFFAGDLGQRIFRQPFSWMRLGVDVRGRSSTLKVNYRTSHQIRRAADRLLPNIVKDMDGLADERSGTVSVFDGPEPDVLIVDDVQAEQTAAADILRGAVDEGMRPEEIGVFVRSEAQLSRARAAVRSAGLSPRDLSDHADGADAGVLVGTMHLAKGLEFRMVVLMACDNDVLPLAERVQQVADEFELDEVLTTERQLLYVAATRARDRLVVTAVNPASELLDDLMSAS